MRVKTPCRYLNGHGARGGVVDCEVVGGALTRFGKLYTCRHVYSSPSTTDGQCNRAARRIENYRQGASVLRMGWLALSISHSFIRLAYREFPGGAGLGWVTGGRGTICRAGRRRLGRAGGHGLCRGRR